MTTRPRHDVVVVGGGIAGGAFASLMARAGADVLVLERQFEYRDRVRGELLWPWGVQELQRMALEDVLMAAGANIANRLESHDELEGPGGPGTADDLSVQVEGVPGSLNLYHPAATQALVDAASGYGARVITGAGDVAIETRAGAGATVSWADADGAHDVYCGLVIGADGRNSTVRRQAGIELQSDPPAHVATGLLVDGLVGDGRTNMAARAEDMLFLSFPQQNGRARLYYCIPTSERARFAGPDAASVFLRTAGDITCLPHAQRWMNATPAGPCATFTCEDTWVDAPFRGSVALIGEAGGYNNPLIGQGLSLALRDAALLSDQVLNDGGPTSDGLNAYAGERAERMRRARISCLLAVWVNDGFRRQDPDARLRLRERVAQDEMLVALRHAQWLGFHTLPCTPSDGEVRERLFS